MTTLYIHGFASTGESSKVDALRTILAPEPVLAPTLSHNPAADFEMLCDYVYTQKVTTVVGSSLGGFYALALAQRFDLRVVLINPSLRPYETLRDRIGTVTVYGTDHTFAWTDAHLGQLREVSRYVERALDPQMSDITWANVYVLLGAKDDLVDPKANATALRRAHVITDPDEGHRFDAILKYADVMRTAASSSSDYGEPLIGDT